MAVNRGQRGLLQVVTDLQARGVPAPHRMNVLPDGGGEQARREAARSLSDTAGEMAKIGAEIGRYADHAAAVEGRKEGHIAGMDPEFRPRDDGTIRGEAYDRAGLETFKTRTLLEIDADIAKGGDLRKKQEAWLSNVPRDLVPEVAHAFKRAEITKAREAARAHAQRVEQEALASVQAEVDTAVKGMHQRAFSLGIDGEADVLLAKDYELLRNTLSRRGVNGQPLVAPAQAGKILEKAREAVVDARLLGTFERTPTVEGKAALLRQLDEDFAGSKGLPKEYDLNGFLRIRGKLEGDLRSAIADRGRQHAGVLEDIKGATELVGKGFVPTEDQMAGLRARVEAAADPEVRGRFEILEDTAGFQAGARRARPAELDAYATQERARMRTAGVTRQGAARVQTAEKLADTARAEIKQDMLGWTERTGVMKITPLDLSDPEKAASSLRARIVEAEQAAKYWGEKPQYLRPDDKKQLALIMSQGGAAVMDVSRVVATYGGDRAQAILGEIAGEAPVAARIGWHGVRVPGSSVARDAADGLALAKTDGFKAIAPPSNRARDEAIAVHRGAFKGMPQAEQAAIAATNAAYEIRARRRGVSTFDADLWQQTYKEMLGERQIDGRTFGGVAGSRPGRVTAYSGAVIVPPNVRQDGFHDLVRSIEISDFGDAPPRFANGKPVTKADLGNAALEMVGDGRYWLNMGSADVPLYLKGSGEEPFTLDLNALEPKLKQRRSDLYLGGKPPLPGMMRLGGPRPPVDSVVEPATFTRRLTPEEAAEGEQHMKENGRRTERTDTKETPWYEVLHRETGLMPQTFKKGAPLMAEIDDSNVHINEDALLASKSKAVTIGDVLDHPELYARVPELAGLKISLGRMEDHGWPQTVAGLFRRDTREIILNEASYRSFDVVDRRWLLFHELQHAIDQLEGGEMTEVIPDSTGYRADMTAEERRRLPPSQFLVGNPQRYLAEDVEDDDRHPGWKSHARTVQQRAFTQRPPGMMRLGGPADGEIREEPERPRAVPGKDVPEGTPVDVLDGIAAIEQRLRLDPTGSKRLRDLLFTDQALDDLEELMNAPTPSQRGRITEQILKRLEEVMKGEK